MLENTISDLGKSLGLGDKIDNIAKELLLIMFNPNSGGFQAFADKIAEVSGTNLSHYLAMFSGDHSRMPENDIIELLGLKAISQMTSDCGLSNSKLITSISALMPKLLNFIAPGGVIDTHIPASIASYSPALAKIVQAQSKDAETEGLIADLNKDAALPESELPEVLRRISGLTNWAIPIFLLVFFSWIGWTWINRQPERIALKANFNSSQESKIIPSPALAEGHSPADHEELHSQDTSSSLLIESAKDDSARAALLPEVIESAALNQKKQETSNLSPKQIGLKTPSLKLQNNSGRIIFSGTVADEETKNSILRDLNLTFGADLLRGELTVDDRVGSSKWREKLPGILPELKTEGITFAFLGETIRIGGSVPRATLNSSMLKANKSLGQGFSIATDANLQ